MCSVLHTPRGEPGHDDPRRRAFHWEIVLGESNGETDHEPSGLDAQSEAGAGAKEDGTAWQRGRHAARGGAPKYATVIMMLPRSVHVNGAVCDKLKAPICN